MLRIAETRSRAVRPTLHSRRRPAAVVALLAGLSVLVSLVPRSDAQPPGAPCDPALESDGSNLGYRPRDGRCEGLYRFDEVSGGVVYLGSLTEQFDNYTLVDEGQLAIDARVPDDGPVHLRGYSLRPDHLYQMDAEVDLADTPFRWTMEILAAEDIVRRELGVVGWVDAPDAAHDDPRLFVPLHVREVAGDAVQPTGDLLFVFVPTSDLTEIYVSIWSLESDLGDPLVDGQPLGRPPYPRDSPFAFSLSQIVSGDGASRLAQGGRFLLELIAVLDGGGVEATELRFWTPGAR